MAPAASPRSVSQTERTPRSLGSRANCGCGAGARVCRRAQRTAASSTPATPPARKAADGPDRSTSHPADRLPRGHAQRDRRDHPAERLRRRARGRRDLQRQRLRRDLRGDHRTGHEHHDREPDQRAPRGRHRRHEHAERPEQHGQAQVQRTRPRDAARRAAPPAPRPPTTRRSGSRPGSASRPRPRPRAPRPRPRRRPARTRARRAPPSARRAAPARRSCPAGRCGRPAAVARTAEVSAKPLVPTTVATAATTRPMPGHGAAASNAARAGPRMKKTSMLIAS